MTNHNATFFRSILDSITEHLVIIDATGVIQYVNDAWIKFSVANDCLITSDWVGANYLDVCDQSACNGDANAAVVAAGTRRLIAEATDDFYHEYPCHSLTENRWFMMRVTPLAWEGGQSYVVSHQNITERKLAEREVMAMSLIDGLTGIPNRRNFDDFLRIEWRRSMRLNTPVSLALLDLDHFKQFNDGYGHQAGDQCLKRVAKALLSFARRPGDLFARYGGEEFALVLGSTSLKSATMIANNMATAITDLKMKHEYSTTHELVTGSVGVATIYPRKDQCATELIELADQTLYAAKHAGRNQALATDSGLPALLPT